ncbi:MAG TPA: hypothetical protein VFA34_17200 [Actinomycetota bacterium]|jgi:hypothetical protein|nr:hypothetical protein [Actinomycetota bacterium]
MVRRKLAVLIAAGATLVSSAAGATLLRSPDAAADLGVGADDLVQSARDDLARVPELTLNVVPSTTTGVGESLILVIAAQVPAADAASKLDSVNAPFGELSGFSIDAADSYEVTGAYVRTTPDTVDIPCGEELDCADGLTAVHELQPIVLEQVPADVGAYALLPQHALVLTGFRTKRGAEEFLELARAAGVTGLVTIQARKTGGGAIGLGQEPHPDGSGPLLGPLADQELYQR